MRESEMENARRNAVKALAGAVLEKAKDAWLDDNWHDDVESFLHSHLLTLYLLLAGVDRGSYLDEVRCQ
jgi:hypothetical protein